MPVRAPKEARTDTPAHSVGVHVGPGWPPDAPIAPIHDVEGALPSLRPVNELGAE